MRCVRKTTGTKLVIDIADRDGDDVYPPLASLKDRSAAVVGEDHIPFLQTIPLIVVLLDSRVAAALCLMFVMGQVPSIHGRPNGSAAADHTGRPRAQFRHMLDFAVQPAKNLDRAAIVFIHE